MFRTFVYLLGLLVGSASYAAIPSLVHCRTEVNSLELLLHSFTFIEMAEDIYPPRYLVKITETRVWVDDTDPDQPVSSDDDQENPSTPITDVELTGSLSPDDSDLIYFHSGGFIRFTPSQQPTGQSIVTYQLPGQGYDIAREAHNCSLPEPRIGVGN